MVLFWSIVSALWARMAGIADLYRERIGRALRLAEPSSVCDSYALTLILCLEVYQFTVGIVKGHLYDERNLYTLRTYPSKIGPRTL